MKYIDFGSMKYNFLVKNLFYFGLSFFLVILVAYWVPITIGLPGVGSFYYNANLFEQISPRAFVGTIANLFSLDLKSYILVFQLIQLMWLALLLKNLQTGGDVLENQKTPYVSILLVGVFFAFSQVTFTNNIGGFVDIAAQLMVLSSAVLLFGTNQQSLSWQLFLAIGCACVAMLVHEKNIFEILILGIWLLWKTDIKRASFFLVPVGLFSAVFYLLTQDAESAYDSHQGYFDILNNMVLFITESSFNMYGVYLAGGMLWVLLAINVYLFVRMSNDIRQRRIRLFIALSLVIACFLPLLIAHDTTRLVGLIWLPLFLLIRETGFVSLVGQSQKRLVLTFVLCFVHVLVTPPMFIYEHKAFASNCYAEFVLTKVLEPIGASLGGIHPSLSLQVIERRDHTKGNECWPLKPYRW